MVKYFKYIFLFIFTLFFLNFIPFDLDEIWNYGFMHNIYEGLIPYKDFNMVITPFFPFLFSLMFHVFGSNLLVVNILQALIILCTYWLFEKLFGNKANILILVLFFNYDLLYASYNYFVFFCFLLLLYFEKIKVNDYLIGIVIGISILTKQSVGGCLALVSLYYLFNDYKKFLKRVAGIFVPVSIFLIYIFFSDCYREFFDLCILGLFDFGKQNYVGNIFLIFCFIVCLIIIFYKIFRNRKDINNYYVLAFSIIVIPMFDWFHFKFFLFCFLLLFVERFNFSKVNLDLLMYGSVAGISVVNFLSSVKFPVVYPNDIKHFEYRYISNKHLEETKVVSEKLKKYDDREVLFLFEQSYYYKILNDIPINYFDLINTGNWGYDGSNKLFKALKQKKDSIFVINKNSYVDNKQTDRGALKYVLDNGKKIDEIHGFEFYVIEECDN